MHPSAGHMSSADVLTAAKAELRRGALAARDQLPPAERQAAAEAIAARPFPVAIGPGAIVSGFSPMRSEINPLPLMRRLSGEGAKLALPVVAGRGRPLIMRSWEFGDRLVPGVWGIRQPGPEASEVLPDIMLVPLAAFDRSGYRIGYGAGYYDMTIAAVRAAKPTVAIGLAYAAQEIKTVPVQEWDARLDFVLTERDCIDCRG